MKRNKLVQLEENFRSYIIPLMDENGTDDYRLVWEVEKYLDSKRDDSGLTEKQLVRKWVAPLLSK